MSLRIFHIVFITVCELLCLFVAVWGLHAYAVSRSVGSLAFAILFIAVGALLVEYGRRTFRKLKELP